MYKASLSVRVVGERNFVVEQSKTQKLYLQAEPPTSASHLVAFVYFFVTTDVNSYAKTIGRKSFFETRR